jgi:hypothetical protein
MEQKTQKKKKNKMLAVLIQLFIGVIIGFVGGVSIVDKLFSGEWTLARVILFLLFIFIAIFININIHEFGHFIFGKRLGYTLVSYRVAIFTWNNENGQMKFSIIKNKGYDGLCAMIPPERPLPPCKDGLYYAGGIILNILSGLVFIGVRFLPLGFSQPVNSFFSILGGIAVVLGIINFIPFVSQNNPTDGKILWSIIFKKPFARKLIEITKMSSQLSAGIRPRDMQASYSIAGDNLEVFDIMAMIFSYFKALDNNSEDMMYYIDLLEKNIDTFPPQLLPSVYYELCYTGCISGDENKAKEYYKKAGKILQHDKDINGLRVKAYYQYHINKDIEAAMILCENALAVAHKFPIKGQGLMEKDLVISLIEQMKLEKINDESKMDIIG